MKEGEEKRFEIKLYYEISPLLYKNPKIPNQTAVTNSFYRWLY